MMKNLIPISYYTAFSLYGLSLAFHLFRRIRLEIVTTAIALIANGFVLVMIAMSSGHIPVFQPFESFLLAAFILGLLCAFFTRPKDSIPGVKTWVWIEILLLLVITLFFDKNPSISQYGHSYIYIILFHALRIAALSFMLFSSAHFIQFRLDRKAGHADNTGLHDGRNHLLISAVFFLSAEYVGILWCQNGWGDFWMWSQNFFQSTLIVMYLMLAFHIPGKGPRSEGIRSLIGSLSGFFMLTLLVLRSLY
jgi:ABC-type transport system involved in cytochrome c biogenesis permease subunit